MNDRTPANEQRLLELLADRAVQGLSDVEQTELEQLLAAHTDELRDDESFDRAAAAIDISLEPTEFEPLPEDLAAKIRAAAATHLPKPAGEPSDGAKPEPLTAQPAAARGIRELFSLVVAAACLVLAAVSWWSRPAAELPVAQQLEQLIRDADDEITVAWTPTGDPAAPMESGTVVWSNKLQRGFMRFSGLAANDPNENQYQLWIFDAKRNADYPVDGGVFDIPEGADMVIVPIDAKIEVSEPTLFAITVERPGGVVVSDRKRLPLTAAVGDPTG